MIVHLVVIARMERQGWQAARRFLEELKKIGGDRDKELLAVYFK
ncbi:MAG: hypothetical protein PHF50_01020 [Patescibacteria group bacterium]|nr:hypothetical protein [Patescibacteria group bacterium]